MRRSADLLDKVSLSLIDKYCDKTGMMPSNVAEMMHNETWMTSDMAKEMGFVDEITPALKMAAQAKPRFDNVQSFKNQPEQIKVMTESTPDITETATTSEPATFIQKVTGMLADKGELVGKIDSLEKANASLNEDKAGLALALNKVSTELASLQTERQTLEAKVNELTAERKTVAETVIDKVAEIGFPADKLPGNADVIAEKTPSDIAAAYAAIKDPYEQARFYAKNKSAIFAAARKQEQERKAQPNN